MGIFAQDGGSYGRQTLHIRFRPIFLDERTSRARAAILGATSPLDCKLIPPDFYDVPPATNYGLHCAASSNLRRATPAKQSAAPSSLPSACASTSFPATSLCGNPTCDVLASQAATQHIQRLGLAIGCSHLAHCESHRVSLRFRCDRPFGFIVDTLEERAARIRIGALPSFDRKVA